MILEIIEEVAATSSKNKKLEILKYHKDNNVLKRVIKMCYDPFLQFWIRKIPDYTAEEIGVRSISQGLDQLEALSSREVTGNAAIERLKSILETQDKDNAIIIERIIGKDLRAGFSAGTANKVWGPNFIPEWPVMLCSPFEQRLIDKMAWPAMLQMKMDGLRVSIIVKDNKVEYRTRNGKLMDLLGSLDAEFIAMAEGRYLVFDGELLVLDKEGNPLERKVGNGIIVKAQKGTLSQEEANCVAVTLWDMIDGEAFTTGIWNEKYIDRFNWLIGLMLASGVPVEKIRLVASSPVDNIDQCMEIVNKYIAQGQEGAILKDMNSPWQDARSRSSIKFKAELDCDLICTGWEYGTGKNAQRLGALVLESSDGKVKTAVGSGFTDEDRNTITQDVIGKIVSVKYNARITKRDSDIDSLFLPIFLEVRSDLDEADSSSKIK